MYDSSHRPVSGDLTLFQSTPAGQKPEPSRRSKPEPEPKPTVFAPLMCFYVRDFNYHPQPNDIDLEEVPSPSPVRISTDILFIGGFAAGLKLDPGADLDLRFVDEYGRVFECRCYSRIPSQVVLFLPRGFVRLRLYCRDFYWRRLDTPPLKNEARAAYAVIGVVDEEGGEHNFNFWVDEEIRDLFPVAPREVT